MNKKWIPWNDRTDLQIFSMFFCNKKKVEINDWLEGRYLCQHNKKAYSMLKYHWNENYCLRVDIGRIPEHILLDLLFDNEEEGAGLFHSSNLFKNSAFDISYSMVTSIILSYLEYDFVCSELNDKNELVYKKAILCNNPDGDYEIYYQDYSVPRPAEESDYIVPVLKMDIIKGFQKLEAMDKFDFDNDREISISAVPASAPVDETSTGRTRIDDNLKFRIGEFIKENPSCSNRAITRNFGLGTGTISSNPDLKAYIERCKQLNLQSMENNPNFDNDPFSNGRGRENE